MYIDNKRNFSESNNIEDFDFDTNICNLIENCNNWCELAKNIENMKCNDGPSLADEYSNVYIYMYMYIYLCVYIYAYVCVCVNTCVYIHVCICICMRVYMCVFVYIFAYVCVYV